MTRRKEIALVVFLTLVGAAVRLFHIGAQSLWLDELFSVAIARGDWIQGVAGTAQGDTNPPLFNLLLHLVVQYDAGETAVRALSCAFAIATLPLFYLLVRDLFDTRFAALATGLLVLNPFHLLFAQEARMYAQLGFLSLAAMLFFVRAWQRGRRADWIAFVALETLAFYTHSLAFLNLLALDVFALAQRSRRRERWRELVLSQVLVLALFAPWLSLFLQQVSRVQKGFWGSPPSVANLAALPYVFLLGNATPVVLVPLALFSVLALVVFGLLALRKVPAAHRCGLALALSGFAFPIGGLFLISLFRPMFVERALIPASFGLYMLLTWTVVNAPPRVLNVLLGALLLLVTAVSLATYYFNPEMQKPPLREAARAVAAQFLSVDTVIHTSDSSALAFEYYAPELPNHFLSGDPDYATDTTRGRSGRMAGLEPEDENTITAGCSRVWLVVALDHNIQYQEHRVSELKSAFRLTSAQRVGGIDLYLLECGGSPDEN